MPYKTLPDPARRANHSKVHLEFDRPFGSGDEALKWLQNHSDSLNLEDLRIDNPHLTVKVGVMQLPEIRLGFAPASGDVEADRTGLLSVLASNGVRAEVRWHQPSDPRR